MQWNGPKPTDHTSSGRFDNQACTDSPISWRAAAGALTERNIKSVTGRSWSGDTLMNMAHRIGLRPPPARMSCKESPIAVLAIWKEHPEFTSRQFIEALGPMRPLGETALLKILRKFRQAGAHASREHTALQWPLDGKTGARIRISVMWKRHPALTAASYRETWAKALCEDSLGSKNIASVSPVESRAQCETATDWTANI